MHLPKMPKMVLLIIFWTEFGELIPVELSFCVRKNGLIAVNTVGNGEEAARRVTVKIVLAPTVNRFPSLPRVL